MIPVYPRSNWLYVPDLSRTRFRMNPHSIVAWMSRNFLLEAGAKSEVWVTATGLEPTTTYLAKWLSVRLWTKWFWVRVQLQPLKLCANVMFFELLLIHKIFLGEFNFKDIPWWQNFAREKWRHKVAKFLRGFVVLFWNLVFMCKCSQLRIYADLLIYQSRATDPIHIIILMQSIIPFFIPSFHVLTVVYEQEKRKNNM